MMHLLPFHIDDLLIGLGGTGLVAGLQVVLWRIRGLWTQLNERRKRWRT